MSTVDRSERGLRWTTFVRAVRLWRSLLRVAEGRPYRLQRRSARPRAPTRPDDAQYLVAGYPAWLPVRPRSLGRIAHQSNRYPTLGGLHSIVADRPRRRV